jgi:hypothetical protein
MCMYMCMCMPPFCMPSQPLSCRVCVCVCVCVCLCVCVCMCVCVCVRLYVYVCYLCCFSDEATRGEGVRHTVAPTCVSGVTVVLQWWYGGVTMMFQWCSSGVPVVLQWCYSGLHTPSLPSLVVICTPRFGPLKCKTWDTMLSASFCRLSKYSKSRLCNISIRAVKQQWNNLCKCSLCPRVIRDSRRQGLGGPPLRPVPSVAMKKTTQ